jgi:hypothetical protein
MRLFTQSFYSGRRIGKVYLSVSAFHIETINTFLLYLVLKCPSAKGNEWMWSPSISALKQLKRNFSLRFFTSFINFIYYRYSRPLNKRTNLLYYQERDRGEDHVLNGWSVIQWQRKERKKNNGWREKNGIFKSEDVNDINKPIWVYKATASVV